MTQWKEEECTSSWMDLLVGAHRHIRRHPHFNKHSLSRDSHGPAEWSAFILILESVKRKDKSQESFEEMSVWCVTNNREKFLHNSTCYLVGKQCGFLPEGTSIICPKSSSDSWKASETPLTSHLSDFGIWRVTFDKLWKVSKLTFWHSHPHQAVIGYVWELSQTARWTK